MAKIRHLAIKAEDQEKTAAFYNETFGMTEAWRGPVRRDRRLGPGGDAGGRVRAWVEVVSGRQ
jgi:catechol 2,3-dioxygenase-like lactoylglutathione lyase family enzyme